MTTFYKTFKELCKKKHVSPSWVAEAIGLNRSAATSWKRGIIPNQANLNKLAAYFNVPRQYLLDGNDAQLGDTETVDLNNRNKENAVHEVNVLVPECMVLNANCVLDANGDPGPNCPKTELTVSFPNGILMDISVERVALFSGDQHIGATVSCLYEPTFEGGDVLREVLGGLHYQNSFLGKYCVSYEGVMYIARLHNGGGIKAVTCISSN